MAADVRAPDGEIRPTIIIKKICLFADLCTQCNIIDVKKRLQYETRKPPRTNYVLRRPRREYSNT